MDELRRLMPYGTFATPGVTGFWVATRQRPEKPDGLYVTGVARRGYGTPLRSYVTEMADGDDIPSGLLGKGMDRGHATERPSFDAHSTHDLTFDVSMYMLAAATHADPGVRRRDVARHAKRFVGRGWTDRLTEGDIDAYVERRRRVALAFVGTLDAFAFATVTDRANGVGCDVSTWDGLDPELGSGAPLARAIRACPAHAAVLAWSYRRDPTTFPTIDDIRAAEDQVAKALVRHAGIPRRMLRHIASADRATARLPEGRRNALERVMAEYTEDTPPSFATWALGLLARLPGNWVPRGADEWDDYLECLPLLAWADLRCPSDGDLATLVDAGKGWTDLRRRVTAAAGQATPARAFQDLRDVTSALATELLLPASRLARDATGDECFPGSTDALTDQAAFDLAFGGLTATGALRASARWHRRRDRQLAAMEAMPSNPAASSWPAGLPDLTVGSIRVMPITTASGLRAEGAAGDDPEGTAGLDHCVGGYASRCRAGTSRILSLRVGDGDGGWERLSTAEVSWDGAGIVAMQHSARRNDEPPPDASAALGEYLGILSSEPSLVGEEVRVTRRPDADVDTVPISDACGYAWWIPGHWDVVRDTWKGTLPGGFDRATPATMAGAIPVEARWGETWRRARPSPVTGLAADAGDATHDVPGRATPIA